MRLKVLKSSKLKRFAAIFLRLRDLIYLRMYGIHINEALHASKRHQMQKNYKKNSLVASGITRALIGGGGGGVSIFIYLCSARLISFEMTTDFKRNLSGRTPIYEYTPPLPINALVTLLLRLK